MDFEVERRLQWAEQTAVEVGRLLMKGFRAGIESTDKAAGIVTELDRQAEELVVNELGAAFPEDGLVSEEGAAIQSSNGWRWIVDPLDGTTNYVAGLPHFATSYGCLRGDRVELGVVHAPAMSETFTATRGGGAFGPDGPLRAKSTARLRDAVFLLNKCYLPPDVLWDTCRGLLDNLRAFRYLGCISLDITYVAAGRVDGLVLLPSEPWDIAAGVAMLQESGAGYTDLFGDPLSAGERSGMVAAPWALLDEVRSLLRFPQ
ncbi:MAG: inositol monophosphatase [Actinomycetota bacterium]